MAFISMKVRNQIQKKTRKEKKQIIYFTLMAQIKLQVLFYHNYGKVNSAPADYSRVNISEPYLSDFASVDQMDLVHQ